MSNIYYDPEKFGLRIIDTLDYSDGCYQFDYLTVWQDVNTGALYYSEDSGCSCPSPFESQGRDDLDPPSTVEEIVKRADAKRGESYGDHITPEDVRDLERTLRRAARR